MEKKPYFSFNSTIGIGRKEPLQLEEFLGDLKEVFEKHKINYIEKGFIGFNKEGQFGVTSSLVDMSEK